MSSLVVVVVLLALAILATVKCVVTNRRWAREWERRLERCGKGRYSMIVPRMIKLVEDAEHKAAKENRD